MLEVKPENRALIQDIRTSSDPALPGTAIPDYVPSEVEAKVSSELNDQHNKKIAEDFRARDHQLKDTLAQKKAELLAANPNMKLSPEDPAYSAMIDQQIAADKAKELLELAKGAGIGQLGGISDDSFYDDTAKSLTNTATGVVNKIEADGDNPGYVKVSTSTGLVVMRDAVKDCLPYCQKMIRYLAEVDKDSTGSAEVDRVFWLAEQTFKATMRSVEQVHKAFGHPVPGDIMAELKAGEKLLIIIERKVKSGVIGDSGLWLPPGR